jgi:hypothetical protein
MIGLLDLLGEWAMAICYFFMVFSAFAMIVLTVLVVVVVATAAAFAEDVK